MAKAKPAPPPPVEDLTPRIIALELAVQAHKDTHATVAAVLTTLDKIVTDQQAVLVEIGNYIKGVR